MMDILTLLSPALGAVLRLVPEGLKLVDAKRDRDHELKMTELQLKIDQARATQAIDLVHAQSTSQQLAADTTLLLEAIAVQGQKVGVAWVDALNATVRPVVTYWLLALYATAKLVGVLLAVQVDGGWLLALQGAYTPEDQTLLASVLGFWFVDRAIRRGSL